jgi:uncharacterized membrane protein YbaN (DUF454 family)
VKSKLVRGFLIVAGTIFLAIGIIGIVIPILPTTPFLLLAAACYLRGSKRMHDWLLNNRWVGEYIRNYREGRGIRARTKIIIIALLWATILYSTIFIAQHLAIQVLLIVIASTVTVHILTLKTLKT